MNKKGVIDTHFASGWKDNPGKADITASQVIDEFNTLVDANARIVLGKKMIILCICLLPDVLIIVDPDWYSLFESGLV